MLQLRGLQYAAGVYPLVDGRRRGSCVFCVIPGAGVAVALKSEKRCLAILHGLVHIQFEVRDLAGRTIQVYPTVVKKVGGGIVVSKRDTVTSATRVCEPSGKRAGVAALRRRTDDAGAAGCGAGAGGGVEDSDPVAEALDVADTGRKSGNKRSIGTPGYRNSDVSIAGCALITPCLDMQRVGTGAGSNLRVERCAVNNACVCAVVERIANGRDRLRGASGGIRREGEGRGNISAIARAVNGDACECRGGRRVKTSRRARKNNFFINETFSVN